MHACIPQYSLRQIALQPRTDKYRSAAGLAREIQSSRVNPTYETSLIIISNNRLHTATAYMVSAYRLGAKSYLRIPDG